MVYIVLGALLMLRHPNPSVDYVARLNQAALAVPEAQRAWPIYRKAWIEGKIWDLKLHELEVQTAGGGPQETHPPHPGEAGWEKVAPFLEQHAGLLNAARQGGLLTGMGLTSGPERDYVGADRLALFSPDERSLAQPNTLDADYASRLWRESVCQTKLMTLRRRHSMVCVL